MQFIEQNNNPLISSGLARAECIDKAIENLLDIDVRFKVDSKAVSELAANVDDCLDGSIVLTP